MAWSSELGALTQLAWSMVRLLEEEADVERKLDLGALVPREAAAPPALAPPARARHPRAEPTRGKTSHKLSSRSRRHACASAQARIS